MTDRLRVMRIGHSSILDVYRGRERALVENHDIDLTLVIPEHWPHLGAAEQPAVNESFTVESVKTVLTGNIPLFTFDPFALINLLKKYQPRVVDVHEEPYSVSGFQLTWLTRKILPQSRCLFYSAQNIHKRYPPPFSISEQYVYKEASAAYPCSQGVQDVLRAKNFTKPAPIIPLGVDEHLFQPCTDTHKKSSLQKQWGVEGFVVGYMGRLEACKGIDFLLEAVSMLPVDLKWRLLILGSGPLESHYKQQATALNIADKVVWLGEQPARKVPEVIGACDTIVVPSITTATWKEQFGRVAVEAMACAVPVITSNSGSLPEIIADSGIVVKERSSQEILDSILQLIHNHSRYAQLQEAGRHRVLQQYTWRHVAAQMNKLYRSILE